MKRRITRMLAVALCVALALGTVACGEQAAQDAATPTPGQAADRDAVAVQIGEDFTVTYGEVADYYDYIVSMMSYYGVSAPTADADIESYQDEAVAGLVAQKKQLYFAKQLGLDVLTADEEAEVQTAVDEEMEYYFDMFRSDAEAEGAEDIEARAQELFNEELTASGMEMDYVEFEEYIFEQVAQQKTLEKLQEHVRSAAAVDDDDVQAYYDQLLESQTTAYGEDASQYLTDQENFEMNGGDPAVVVPEGFLRVKVVAVAPQEAIDDTYEEKVAQMSEYEAEYGKLMLEDEKANAARLKEIRTLYDALRVETDQMYEAYMADAKAKIEEAKAKLDGGEPIDAVLESYGEDAAYTEYALIAEHGRLMAQQSGADDFDDALRNAALALADGAYSDVLQVDDAYYIVYRVGTETAGTRTLDEVREAVEAAALTAEADAVWAEQEAEWDDDDSMVTYHEEVYRSIGKS